MINLKHATWLGLGIAAVALLVGAAFFPVLPDQVATHFDWRGQPNGYSSRTLAVFLLPGIIAAMALLFAALPALSPRGYAIRGMEDTAAIIAVVTELFMLLVHVAMLRAARDNAPLSPGLAAFGLGALLAIIGNRMGKMRRNFFIGIRTPWTLADEEVWLRTHRMGGKVFVAAGLASMVAALLPWGLVLIAPIAMAAGLVPTVYSFRLYRQLHPRAGG